MKKYFKFEKCNFHLLFVLLFSLNFSCTGKFDISYDKNHDSTENQRLPNSNPGSNTTENPIESQKAKLSLSQSELVFSEGSLALLSLELEEKYKQPIKISIKGYVENNEPIANDFINFQSEAIIPAGSLSTSLLLTTLDDSFSEGTEKFTIQLSTENPEVEIKNKTLNIQINDNDPVPNINFELASYSFNESSGENFIKVKLSGPSSKTVKALITKTDRSATSGEDYDFSDTVVEFSPGEVEKTVPIKIISDSTIEGTEDFNFNIKTFEGLINIGTSGAVQVGIVDDDEYLPQITLEDVSVLESESVATLMVKLDSVSAKDIQFNWATINESATAEKDFKSQSEVGVVIPAGSLSKTITIPIIDDSIDEEDIESFIVQLSGVTNALLKVNNVHVNIRDNDDFPAVTFTMNKQSVAEGIGSVTLDLKLSQISEKQISVPLIYTGTATADKVDYEIRSKNIIFLPGQTHISFVVNIIDDVEIESTESIIVSIGSSINANTGLDAQQIISINDNDNSLTVNQISSSTANGAFTTGSILDFQVAFSGVVNVDTLKGTPQLQLQTGTAGSFAKYVGGSGTDTLNFQYTVQAGDNTAQLDYANSGALMLNGAQLLGEQNQSVNTLLPTPTGSGSLSASKEIIIDTKNPDTVSNITVTEWSSSLTETPLIAWDAATDNLDTKNISSYEIALGTTPGGTDVQDWTTNGSSLSRQQTGLQLNEGSIVYPSIKAIDKAGNKSKIKKGKGWKIDTVAPTQPEYLEVEIESNKSKQTLAVKWKNSIDSGSGISHYEVAIGTESGKTDIKDWINVGNTHSTKLKDLSLNPEQNYFISLRAKDKAGNTSTVYKEKLAFNLHSM